MVSQRAVLEPSSLKKKTNIVADSLDLADERPFFCVLNYKNSSYGHYDQKDKLHFAGGQ